MITRKELTDFATFCQNKYNLSIPVSAVEDFMEYYETLNAGNTHLPGDTECALDESGCAHIAFDSVKCNKCMN